MVFTEGQRGQDSLRNILRWYSAIDPEVGYVCVYVCISQLP